MPVRYRERTGHPGADPCLASQRAFCPVRHLAIPRLPTWPAVAAETATRACSATTALALELLARELLCPAGKDRRAAQEGSHVADSVLYQVDSAVATITINRPAARNALT